MIKPISFKNNNQTQKSRAVFSTPVVMLPEGDRNYCLFNMNKVNFIVSQKKNALPYLKEVLQTSQDEKEIVEALYIIDRMIDSGTKGIPAMYPVLAKFNDTKSQNIQTFLAGIYRKTQVPDAFGPLVKMLINNSKNYPSPNFSDARSSHRKIPSPSRGEGESAHSSQLTAHPFDANEEIGGAILEYIRNYSNNPKAIDYSA